MVLGQGALEAVAGNLAAADGNAGVGPSDQSTETAAPQTTQLADDDLEEGAAGGASGLVETERDRLIRLVSQAALCTPELAVRSATWGTSQFSCWAAMIKHQG